MPYHVCGAQQDNSTACVSSAAPQADPADRRRRRSVFYSVGGGESGYIAPRSDATPTSSTPAATAACITRLDRRTGQQRAVNPYPRQPDGLRVGATSPSASSGRSRSSSRRSIRTILYVGVAARLEDDQRRPDAGTKISPDLTRHDPKTMGDSGGPITHDKTGVETYADDLHASRRRRRTPTSIWTGSDDGFVHVTRDGGKTWTNVTPKDLPRLRAHQPDRRVAVPTPAPRTSRRTATSTTTSRPTSSAPTTTARPGRRSSTASAPTTSRARSARIRSARSCSTSAPSTASTSRSTTARTGSRCGRTCPTRRCTTSRSRSATS